MTYCMEHISFSMQWMNYLEEIINNATKALIDGWLMHSAKIKPHHCIATVL